MRRFTVLVIALVLAPGLQSAVVQTRPELSISTFPDVIGPEIVQLPGVIATPEFRPLPVPEVVVPELRPELIPEVEAVVPEIISINPCDACFEYMNALIGQLTEVAVPEVPVHPELPEVGLPEPVVPRPLPETVPEDLRPLPTPEEGEVEINPIPLPVAPELGEVLPLPLPIAPEVEISPLPLPVAPEVSIRPLPAEIPPLVVSSEALPEDY